MRIDKVRTYLGFAIKSGKVIFGSDKLFESKKLPHFVIICSTQNDKVTSKVIKFCEINNIKVIKLKDLVLANIVDRNNCKVIGVLDFNLAKAIINEFQMENNIN